MDHSPDADRQDDPAAAKGQVREARTGRLFVGQLALEDGRVIKVRIRNLSEGGFGGRSDMPLQPGQRGHMLLAGVGLVTGQVVWTNEHLFGLQFDAKIDPALVRLSPATTAPAAEYVVPPQFRPTTDHKRPGFRVR
ncbi:PilZ domain-containing protein [Sphingomonas sp. LaA6.9]|uniref:PilZ domain-containing protein n=1 Tax=Sphingomonas sp. LaA6.9 TaxID=2919914 RepID=UPI001F4F401A|nr:PilZ domain-containing protein [Sphingomonas sp. LaA6.9]MCJ8156538.1 PilZ domain-containing protein [Sphingomonas sp. LaA6.9]